MSGQPAGRAWTRPTTRQTTKGARQFVAGEPGRARDHTSAIALAWGGWSWHGQPVRRQAAQTAIGAVKGGSMDFSAKLDQLQQRVAAAKSAVQAAASESRERLRQRIDQAQADLDQAGKDTQQQADQTADRAQSRWAQMKADAAAWTVDNAQLAILDAIDARAYADQRAKAAAGS